MLDRAIDAATPYAQSALTIFLVVFPEPPSRWWMGADAFRDAESGGSGHVGPRNNFAHGIRVLSARSMFPCRPIWRRQQHPRQTSSDGWGTTTRRAAAVLHAVITRLKASITRPSGTGVGAPQQCTERGSGSAERAP